MTATVVQLSMRRRSAQSVASNPAPSPFTPNVATAAEQGDGRGEIFYPLIVTLGGRREYDTPHGRAFRLGGRWFVCRDGCRPMAVTVADLVARLDESELQARTQPQPR